MLEPTTSENKRAFNALRRRQRLVLVWSVISGLGLGVILPVVPEKWMEPLLWMVLIVVFLTLGILEYHKTRIFFRDLGERGNSDTDDGQAE